MTQRIDSVTVSGIRIPDSKIAREATQLLRDTGSNLLLQHSIRVYFWAALTAKHQRLSPDPELLYAAAIFHDLGLTGEYHGSSLRFEVDSANAARDFLKSHGIDHGDAQKVWTAIAFHTTPGIPEFLHAEAAALQAGAAMDVAGRGHEQFTDEERDAIVAAYPREEDFEHSIIDAFFEGMKRRPMTTVGTFNDDFLAFKDPGFQRVDMCRLMLGSPWPH